MNTKPFINKTFHALSTTRFAPLHMQDSGKYSINTEASANLQLYERLVEKDIIRYYKNGRGDDIQ